MEPSYEYIAYPTYSVKLWEGFEINGYHKIPCRFHRWMMHVLLGWQFKILKEDK